jgi:hypothetical protein
MNLARSVANPARAVKDARVQAERRREQELPAEHADTRKIDCAPFIEGRPS